MLFPIQGFLRFKRLFGSRSNSLRIGRFEFADGGETTPQDKTLALIKRDRINQRLIGQFTFTHVQRSFYGVHYQHDTPKLNWTLVGAFPTRGVFQVDGWVSVAKTEQVADLAEELPGGCAVLLRDSVGGARLFVRWTILRSVRGGIGLQLLDLPL
jgi:hypothetical protein